MLHFPPLIKLYRQDVWRTQVDMAKAFHVSTRTIIYWENGEHEAPYRVTEEVMRWFILRGGVDQLKYSEAEAI